MAENPDLDGLVAKLQGLIGKATRTTRSDDLDLDDDGDTRGRAVPYHRFAAEVKRRREAEARYGEMETALADVIKARDAAVAEVRDGAAKAVKDITSRHAEDLGLVDLGVRDPLGRKALRDAWEAVPKETRGESALKWWESTVAAHKAHLADPKKAEAPAVPGTLAGYLPQGDAPAVAPAPGKPPPRELGQRSNNGVDATLAGLPQDDIGAFLSGLRNLG